jgi:hypothetical protein
MVMADGFGKQNLAKQMERVRRQSVVNSQISKPNNRRKSIAQGLQSPSKMKLATGAPSSTKLDTSKLGGSKTNLNQRRSSFAVIPGSMGGMDALGGEHSFKGAADRIRRMSCALSPFGGSLLAGGMPGVPEGRRNSIRASTSTNTSPRFSLTPDSLGPAADKNRRKSMARSNTGLGLPVHGQNRRKSFINFAKSKEALCEDPLHHEQMTPASEALTNEQIQAFKEAFDLFDNNGGGTIDSAELKETLDSVGIEIDQEDIEDVMLKLDEDGNGEIDFEEFLNLMTNTEMFLEAFARKKNQDGTDANEHGYRDHLLFDALTEFMKKSALKAADEIVGYYAKKYKKVVKAHNMNKGAHVVGHYADGARLIGLTEKQIYRELKRLRMYSNLTKDEKNSPYAQPLNLSFMKTQPRTKRSIRPPKRVNSARSCNSSNASRNSHDNRTTEKPPHDRKRNARRMSMLGIQNTRKPKFKSAATRKIEQGDKKRALEKKKAKELADKILAEKPKPVDPPLSVTHKQNTKIVSHDRIGSAEKSSKPVLVSNDVKEERDTFKTLGAKALIANTQNTFNQTQDKAYKPHGNKTSMEHILHSSISEIPAFVPKTPAIQPASTTNISDAPKTMKDILAGMMRERKAKEALEPEKKHKIRITVKNPIKDSKSGPENQKVRMMQSIIEQQRASRMIEKSPSEILPNIHQPGWLLQRTCVLNTDMPIHKKWSRVSVGLLPKLREVVKKKVKKFVKRKEDSKLEINMQHFRELDTRAAGYNRQLMHQFLAVSSAYSCATPDNRIRLQVENLEKIQHKDEKLRDKDDQLAKRGGGDSRMHKDSRMGNQGNNNNNNMNNHGMNNNQGINKTNNNSNQGNNNNNGQQGAQRRQAQGPMMGPNNTGSGSALDTIRKSLGKRRED